MMRISLGRRVFGLAAIGFGIVTLVWQDFNTWQQIAALGNISHRAVLADIVGTIEILGGLAIQWPKTARVSAAALGAIFLAFALLWVPRLAAQPLVYDGWGNLFEQLSQVAGAVIVFGTIGRGDSARTTKTAWIGYVLFGICVVSFTLEQLLNLSATASFVPKRIPPGQMFWAITTTIALGLSAVALLTGRVALLASRLLTLMLAGFGLLVWFPALLAGPHAIFNWAANAENWAITGAAWIVTDFLGERQRVKNATARFRER